MQANLPDDYADAGYVDDAGAQSQNAYFNMNISAPLEHGGGPNLTPDAPMQPFNFYSGMPSPVARIDQAHPTQYSITQMMDPSERALMFQRTLAQQRRRAIIEQSRARLPRPQGPPQFVIDEDPSIL